MDYNGIIKKIDIKASDTDKYVKVLLELDLNSNVSWLYDHMLQTVKVKIDDD